MRLIKMTGGLGNQMFIYAFYLKMKKLFPHTKIDLSDMMHYHVHHGYEMNRVFALPHVEFCMNRTGKKILEFLFFKTILERKQKELKSFWKSYSWPLSGTKALGKYRKRMPASLLSERDCRNQEGAGQSGFLCVFGRSGMGERKSSARQCRIYRLE